MFMVSLWLEVGHPLRRARRSERGTNRIARRRSEAERAEAFFPPRSDNDDGGCQARSAPSERSE